MPFFDVYSLFFLVVAVAIIWKLRSVLGTRTGSEQPPADRFAPRPDAAERRTGGDTIVPIKTQTTAAATDPAEPASALDEALRVLVRADRSFDQAHFLGGARSAYEMIVTAFAAADRRALKPLLTREVFDGFSAALDEREKQGQAVETRFVGIDRAEITEASVKGSLAEITVRFVSQLITVTRDRQGAVIDGDATRVSETVDVWTFVRDVTSSDPNWRLASTAHG